MTLDALIELVHAIADATAEERADLGDLVERYGAALDYAAAWYTPNAAIPSLALHELVLQLAA